MSDGFGFADIYSMDADEKSGSKSLDDVTGDDWRNILVLGRAMPDGVYGETLALVGRARYMADELGCRVEVLLIGEELQAATEQLQKYAINTIYQVKAPSYASIQHTARILEEVVRKRRPELVLAFQSRTGDAITGYAANRLGVGFVTSALAIEIDTMERRARVTHAGGNKDFQIVSQMNDVPQFVSVQRGLFRAPMEDPYASPAVHELEIDIGKIASIEVIERNPPPVPELSSAEKVVVAGSRIKSAAGVEAAKALADKLGAAFAVTQSVVDRGLADDYDIVGDLDCHVEPKLLVAIGVRGSLDFMQAIDGSPVIVAVDAEANDPISTVAAYRVAGDGSAIAEQLCGLI